LEEYSLYFFLVSLSVFFLVSSIGTFIFCFAFNIYLLYRTKKYFSEKLIFSAVSEKFRTADQLPVVFFIQITEFWDQVT